MRKCTQKTCWPDAGCSLGHLDLSTCPGLSALPTEARDSGANTEGVALPWSGSALGLGDLGFVAGRRKPFLVAIMGPQSAGKTTLLGAWYLLLGRGLPPGEALRFSGSRSLTGWEVVASSLRWEPGSVPPGFPPHTTSTSARIPGLLHLAFRGQRGQQREYLVTDAPGEWFQKWAVRTDAADGEGARWAAEHADAFILIADRDALAGPEKGAARTGIQLLARRLAGEVRGRPVAFVWTKCDVAISEEIEDAVREAVLRVLPTALEFSVSVMRGGDGTEDADGLLAILQWIVSLRRPGVRLRDAGGYQMAPDFGISRR